MLRSKRQIVEAGSLQNWSELGQSLFPEGSPESDEFPSSTEINSKVVFWAGGDLSCLKIDAIVNPSNERLIAGGSTCGVIHKIAGPELASACANLGGCSCGNAVLTDGFNLPCSKVIHAVGPIGDQPDLLRTTYRSVMKLVDGESIRSVGLCPISGGVCGFPVDRSAEIALSEVRSFLNDNHERVDRIVLAVDDEETIGAYERWFPNYFPVERPAFVEEVKPVEENASFSDEEEEEEEEMLDIVDDL